MRWFGVFATAAGGLCALAATMAAGSAYAAGEEVDGYPSWTERVYLQWANRARVDPQLEMEVCGDDCPDAACYTPQAPLRHDIALARPSRFHAQELEVRGFFSHTSNCTLVDDIAQRWPDECDGAAQCACVGGVAECDGTCTSAQGRVGLFGAGYGGEITVGVSDPDWGFYLWLHETSTSEMCQFGGGNGHRWLLLTSQGRVGFGAYGSMGNGDFGFGGGGADEHPIASGSHYPRTGASVEAWANWYAQAGPSLHTVNVDGTCEPMTLERGEATNGAYSAALDGLDASQCHRYYFVFKDAAGQTVTYPTEGSLGIGPAATCADWSDERPAMGDGCDCQPSCEGAQCGDDGCGGSCGECGGGEGCEAGQCVADPDGDDDDDDDAGETGDDDGAGDNDGADNDASEGGAEGDDDDAGSERADGGADAGGDDLDPDTALPGGFGADRDDVTGCRIGGHCRVPMFAWLFVLAAMRRRAGNPSVASGPRG